MSATQRSAAIFPYPLDYQNPDDQEKLPRFIALC
jgi:hypothetical protein